MIGLLDRFLLLICSLAVLILSVTVLVVCTYWISFDLIWNNFLFWAGRWETVGVAVLFLLISLRLLRVSVKFAGKALASKETVIIQGSIGEVQVTVEAIKNLVEKMAHTIVGVRNVKVSVEVVSAEVFDRIHIKIRLVIGQKYQVAEVCDAVRGIVSQNLTEFVGLKDFIADVIVDDISNAPVQKQRVV